MTNQPETTKNLYHLILGLPEEVTSPNYYQLLGLDGRTNDPQVIKNAAADQNRKLLSWQNSDRYAEVRALTFEIVQARDTLLNQDSRDTYDIDLGDWGMTDEGPWIVEETPAPSFEPLSVHCPECKAEFKLRNRDHIGRRLPCPECGFRFEVLPEAEAKIVILEAKPLLDEADSDADLKALENFEDMEDLPAPASPRARRSRSRPDREGGLFEEELLEDEDGEGDAYENYEPRDRRRSRDRGRIRTATAAPPILRRSPSRSSGKWAVLGGGVLMGIGLLILVAVSIQRMDSSPATTDSDRLAYLPADSKWVGYYRLGDLARAPALQNHLTHNTRLRAAADQFRDRMGMELQEIDSMTIGVREGYLTWFQSANFLDRPHPNFKFVALVRSSKDWDRTKLIGDHTQSATQNGMTFHLFSLGGPNPERWAIFLVDARTLLFGTEAEVRAAMDTGGKAPLWPDAEFLRQEYALLAAQVPSSPPVSSPGPRPSGRTAMNGPQGRQLGSGLLMEGDEFHKVDFMAWNSEADAENYIALGVKAEEARNRARPPRPGGNSGWADVRFQRYGRTVAIIEDRNSSQLDYGQTAPLYAPLEMLAHLGADPAPAVDHSNPPPNRAVNLPNNPPPNPVIPPADPNALAPPPDPVTLDSLVRDLQVQARAKAAAHQLAKLEPVPQRQKEVAALLEQVIQTGGHFDKQAAADALGVWGSADNVPFLIGLLDGNDIFLKKHVLTALGRLKDPRALPVLVESLKNIHMRTEAKRGLEFFGSQAEPELLKVLATSEWQHQQPICEILRTVGTSRSLPQLDALAGSGHIFVRTPARSAAAAIRRGNR